MKTRTLNWLAVCGALVASCPGAADPANPLTGFYYGTATIDNPAAIGTIDLAFYLDIPSSGIQNAWGYIDLAQTLLFPAVAPQIGGKDVGPRVSGKASSDTDTTDCRDSPTTLTSDTFQSVVSGKTVTRLVKLCPATVGNSGASLSGTYTEKVTGLTPDELVISGTFILAKPLPITADSGVDRNGDGCLTLAEIRAGGSDPATIEFSDLSAALNLFRNPGATLRVGDPPGPNCTNAEQTVQAALRDYQATHP